MTPFARRLQVAMQGQQGEGDQHYRLAGHPAGDRVLSDYAHSPKIEYIVGQTIEIPNFDTNRWHECAPGIHHYITREEAVKHEN